MNIVKNKRNILAALASLAILSGCGGGGGTSSVSSGGDGYVDYDEYPAEVNGYPLSNYLKSGDGTPLDLVAYECYTANEAGEYFLTTEGHTSINGGFALSGTEGTADLCSFVISPLTERDAPIVDIHILDFSNNPFEEDYYGWEYQVTMAASNVDTSPHTLGEFGPGRIPFEEMEPLDEGLPPEYNVLGSFVIYDPDAYVSDSEYR